MKNKGIKKTCYADLWAENYQVPIQPPENYQLNFYSTKNQREDGEGGGCGGCHTMSDPNCDIENLCYQGSFGKT